MVSSSTPAHRYWRLLALCGPAVVGLLSLLLLLTACGFWQQRGEDPMLRYRPAMKPDFVSQLDEVTQAPRYDINVTFDPSNNLIRGNASIVIVNPSPEPWRYLIFRLYPALKQYGSGITVRGAAVDEQPAPFSHVDEARSILRVNLLTPLNPGEQATIQLAWVSSVPQWSDTAGVYALYGSSQQITSLPLFYPSLAVYQPGTSLSSGRWWTDTGSVRGDAAFNYTSLFVVTATLPSDQVPVTSGTLVTSTLLGNNQARHVWVTGPSREFLLQFSPLLQSTYTETYGTRVTSYWLPGQEAAGRAALVYTIAALRIYSDRFGPYPYRDLRVSPAPLAYRGMEYPQAILLGPELYTRYRENLEGLVAHEVAHQWWYLIVHNDPVREPWLDEALAEYSMRIYFEELQGNRAADGLMQQRWQAPLRELRARGDDRLVSQTVDSFDSPQQYETVVYAKGALFYDALRTELGDRQFFRFLHRYLANHRYGIVDTATWQRELAALQNPAVDALYAEWVSQPGANSVSQAEQ